MQKLIYAGPLNIIPNKNRTNDYTMSIVISKNFKATSKDDVINKQYEIIKKLEDAGWCVDEVEVND